MSGSHATDTPDGRLILEAGVGEGRAKLGAVVSGDDAAGRDRAHHLARLRDARIESARGLTRATRDRDRTYPRPAGTLNPRKIARPPSPEAEVRSPGRYQSRVRHAALVAAQTRMRNTEYRALGAVLNDQQRWNEINTMLTETHASGQTLGERDRVQVQRIDRAIRRYEEVNDREHVVYAGLEVELDASENMTDFLDDWTHPGERFTFDQFTAAAHDAAAINTESHNIALLEIVTTRGMYLGDARSGGNSGHLLPRGLEVEVEHVRTATVVSADGMRTSRTVIRLRERSESSGGEPE